MRFSIHIPLGFGHIKIKTRNRLRSGEREKRVPVWNVGNLFFIWNSKKAMGDRRRPGQIPENQIQIKENPSQAAEPKIDSKPE